MTSFRRQIQYSAMALIVVLLVAFDLVVFWSFSTVLHSHVDSRLQAVAEGWADIVARNPRFLLDFQQADQEVDSAVPEESQQIELREAALSIRVLSLNGTVLWEGSAAVPAPTDPQVLETVSGGEPVFDTVHTEGSSVRRVWVPIREEGTYILQAETSLRVMEKALNGLAALLAGASGVALILAWFGSTWLARQALIPVEVLSATAQKISEPSSLGTRLVLNAPYEEFQRLVHAFNTMMDRLQKVFEGQRRFVADAAHEIQTPLTALKGNLEVAFRKNRKASEYRETLISNLGAVERLINLCRSLITLAKLSAVHVPTHPLSLEPLVRELMEELTVLADDRHLSIRLESRTPPLVRINDEQMQRVFINLLSNAFRHTPPGGTVTVRLGADGQHAVIAVSDTGEGIASEHLPHIFERFYRVDHARSRESGGVGLGLAIVKEIVEAHDGDIHVTSDIGKGTTFTIRFPGLRSSRVGQTPPRRRSVPSNA